MNSNQKKAFQLGMPHGTAHNRLRKEIIFSLIKRLKENFCFQCGAEITTLRELSIEHKIPYLDSEDPKKLFFDLDNIAYSHLSCNVAAARSKEPTHGLHSTYNNAGCRCTLCTAANTKRKQMQRSRQ